MATDWRYGLKWRLSNGRPHWEHDFAGVGRKHPRLLSCIAPDDQIPRTDAAWRAPGKVCISGVVHQAERGVSRPRPRDNVCGHAPAQQAMLERARWGGSPRTSALRKSVTSACKKRLKMDSRELREPELHQRSPSRVAPSSDGVDQRKAAHGERPVGWCETALRAPPRAPQGPPARPRLHGHCLNASAVVSPRVCAPAVTDAFRRIAPRVQAALTIVRSRVTTGTRRHRRLEPGRDRPGWDVC